MIVHDCTCILRVAQKDAWIGTCKQKIFSDSMVVYFTSPNPLEIKSYFFWGGTILCIAQKLKKLGFG